MHTLPLLLLLGLLPVFSLRANPTGGVLANGSASIAGQGTPSVLINQSSDRAIINWQTFSIDSGELTKFVQPSSTSAALNRVLGGQTSYINGTLSANGQIFLLNGNGIVVGPGGVINTAGFTGSTRDIADSDFMSNHLHFVGSSDGGVKNLGTISALGGDVVLIGKTVENRGTIQADGTAALVAGDDVLLAQKNADGSTVTVNPVSSPGTATTKVGVRNTGTIEASSAELKAANGNIYALAIQNEGLVQATTVTQQGGHIYLTTDDGTIVNSGTLDASATAAGGTGGTILVKSTAGKVVHSGSILARGGSGGRGGSAEVSAPVVDYTGTVDLRAPGGKSGTLLLDPDNLIVNASGTGTAPDTSYISNGSVDNALSGGDFILNTNDNLAVNAEIDWYTGSNLTLSTNNAGSTIAINAPINGTSGSLTIDTAGSGDLITSTLSGAVTVNNFYLQSGEWFQLVNDGTGNNGDIPQTYDIQGNPLGTLPVFNVTGDFEIGNSASFLRANGGNGTTAYYGLVDVFGLQGMNGFLNSNFTLNGGTIDASVTSNWNPVTVNNATVDQGFAPIGSNSEGGFQGALTNGSINNLTINRSSSTDVGLISSLNSNGTLDGNGNLAEGLVKNLQLNYATIQGQDGVGGVVGYNSGALDAVSVFDSTITGTTGVGGLAGYQGGGYLDDNGDQIHTNSSQDGYSTITGQSYVGGLVGRNQGQIDGVSVYNTTVTGNSYVGGVVGSNDYVSFGPQATITYATFSGTVTYNDIPGPSFNFGGIAGENDGVIQLSNTFPGATVTGDSDVGGIAGVNTGLIQDSYNSAAVSGNAGSNGNSYIGGIAGENSGYGNQLQQSDSPVISYAVSNQPNFLQYGTIQTSYNTGSVTGGTYVGGIVGSNDYASNIVTTDYNVGHVTGSSYAGGIVGDNYGTVEYVYDSGPVSGATGTTGALVGYNESGAVTTNSYWDNSISGQPTVALNGTAGTNIGTVSTSGSAYDPASYAYFGTATAEANLINNGVEVLGTSPDDNSSPAWFILPGDTRPMLTAEFTGNVSNPHQLQLISTDLGGNFYLVQNIDLSVLANPSEVWSSAGFSPIGTNPIDGNSAFSGTFYGNNESISDLTIDRPGTNSVGLFGYVGPLTGINTYSITNLNLTGGSITGNTDVAALAGVNDGTISDVTAGTTVTGGSEVGGIAGANGSSGVVSQAANTGTITGTGEQQDDIGGIVGKNSGTVSQADNTGNVGTGGNTSVGGIVGANFALVDDSYSGGGAGAGTITGSSLVGGLVGNNSGTLETSYNTSTVDSSAGNSGYLVGGNYGTVAHSYWDTQTVGTTAANGIGYNNTDGGATAVDVQGYTTAQLADSTNYAQGAAPQLWNFSPQGTNPGVWGINVYQANYTLEGENYVLTNNQVNDGLPVLQWQTPVNVQVAATNGPHYYGYTPGYTVSGSGAAQLASNMPGGPTLSVTGGNQAGDTDHITVGPTTIDASGYNIEFLDGNVPITPAPLSIVANSYTVPVGAPAPNYGATYTGLQNGDTPSSLDGTLAFAVAPNATATPNFYTIGVSGQSSSNYLISYIPGTLDVYSNTASPQSQQLLTAEAEVSTIQDFFANDPANGLDPIYFLVIPNQFGLDGDLLGAINNEPDSTDYAYASSTSGLPSVSRLVVPGTGVVEILDGAVVVGSPQTGQPIFLTNPGGFLPATVVNNLRGVLSPAAYQQLLALINAY